MSKARNAPKMAVPMPTPATAPAEYPLSDWGVVLFVMLLMDVI